jgi:SnoaL-like domain
MTIEHMIEIEEIRQLKYRYIRGLDTHDFELLTSCFTENATVWYSDGLFQHAGREAIIAFMRSLMVPSFVSSHTVTQPEIELTGPNTARGVWRLEDTVHLTQENAVLMQSGFPLRGGGKIEGAAYYYDDYAKQHDGWKISRSGFVRIFEALTAADGSYQLSVGPTLGVRPA